MRTVIRGATLLDGTGSDPVADALVVVENETIVSAGPERGTSWRSDDQVVIDLEGRTLLPGLMDTHVHIAAGYGHVDETHAAATPVPGYTLLRASRQARIAIEAGITTIRDLGTNIQGGLYPLRQAIRDGLVPGPRLLLAGRSVAMTGGQGWVDESVEVDGPDQARWAVRQNLKEGADCIKLMATSGVGTPAGVPGAPQLTLEELRAAVEETHKAGKKAVAHAHSNQGIRNIIEAGIDTVIHGVHLDEETIDMMFKRHLFLEPTLSVYETILHAKSGVPKFMVERTREINQAHRRSFKAAIETGIPVAVGTDSGLDYHAHPTSLILELECFVREGMSTSDALVTATSGAAQAMGLDSTIGTVQPGKLADIIVVDHNPLDNLRALLDVKLVMQSGRVVKDALRTAARSVAVGAA